MPTIITHGIVSLAAGNVTNERRRLFWLIAVCCSILPDADVIGYQLGIPYGSMFGHRGFSHSIVFTILLTLFVLSLFYRNIPTFTKRWWTLAVLFFFVSLSHPLLDAMTDGGYGVAFFAPFSNERYFFSFRPIHVAPLGVSRLFSHAGWRSISSELVWVWIPCILLSVFVSILRRRSYKRSSKLNN